MAIAVVPDPDMNVLDPFLPESDVRESHEVEVRAEPGVVFGAACGLEFEALPAVRAIFGLRERVMRSHPGGTTLEGNILETLRDLGWLELSREPDRALVLGAVTRPWEADVHFRGIAPERFAAFDEPGLVKIAWTIEVDAIAPGRTLLRTQTRAAGTDEDARRRFAHYWRWARFGIIPIRKMLLGAAKRAAERPGAD